MDNNISFLTGINDPYLKLDNPAETIEDTDTHIVHVIQTYPMHCPQCGQLMRKNGFKSRRQRVRILPISGCPSFLEIKKQQYICPPSKLCPATVTAVAKVAGIDSGCRISQRVKQHIALQLEDNISQKELGKLNFVSANTVERVLWTTKAEFKVAQQWLPKAIAFDDFSSGRFATSGMSMILMNPVNHRLIDVIKSRNSRYMKGYFYRHFSRQARWSVELVVVDLYQPYRHLIHELFPNAKIIADHFHVVVQAYRALQRVRIKVMNHYGSGTHEYRALKHYWKLLVQRMDKLDYVHYYSRRNFRHEQLSNGAIVDRLLDLSQDLQKAYSYYQRLVLSLTNQDKDELKLLLKIKWTDLPYPLQRVQRTLRSHLSEIINSMKHHLSNGPLEGTNNKVKMIKRTACGFRNFNNFRLRILLASKGSNTMTKRKISLDKEVA